MNNNLKSILFLFLIVNIVTANETNFGIGLSGNYALTKYSPDLYPKLSFYYKSNKLIHNLSGGFINISNNEYIKIFWGISYDLLFNKFINNLYIGPSIGLYYASYNNLIYQTIFDKSATSFYFIGPNLCYLIFNNNKFNIKIDYRLLMGYSLNIKSISFLNDFGIGFTLKL